MNNLRSNKEIFKFLFIILFAFIWICIDTNFENTFKILDVINFTTILLFFRSINPFIFILIIFLLFSKNIKLSLFTKNKNINYLIFIFYIFFILQLFSHLVSDNEIFYLYYFFISIFLLFYFSYAFNAKLLTISFYISFFFLIVFFIIFGVLTIKYFFTSSALNLYGTFPFVYESLLTISTNVIRSSGLSRIAMILYIPLYLLLLISPVTKKKYLVFLLISFFIFLSQSRIIILYWIIFSLFSTIFFLWRKKIKIIITKIIFLIIAPLLITGLIVTAKQQINVNQEIIFYKITSLYNFIKNDENNNANESLNKSENVKDVVKRDKIKIIRKVDPRTYSSGRVKYWRQIINQNKRIWIGNGYLGDRYLIQNNASNMIFYTYASGGIVSLLLLAVIILRSLYTTFYLLFIKKVNLTKKNIILISSIFYIGLLIFRGIGENSFAIFSIDLIIFLQSLFICEETLKKVKN